MTWISGGNSGYLEGILWRSRTYGLTQPVRRLPRLRPILHGACIFQSESPATLIQHGMPDVARVPAR